VLSGVDGTIRVPLAVVAVIDVWKLKPTVDLEFFVGEDLRFHEGTVGNGDDALVEHGSCDWLKLLKFRGRESFAFGGCPKCHGMKRGTAGLTP
jgi:hypothetical protein